MTSRPTASWQVDAGWTSSEVTPAPSSLQEALVAAQALAETRDQQRLATLAARLANRRLRILVAGEAKRGKSTVVNALLGRQLLPTGVTPLTSVATTVTSAGGGDEHAVVTFSDGRHLRVPLADISRYVTERENPGNGAGVADVTVRAHARLVDEFALDLVDTPGTGSVFAHNTEDAKAALTTLDAAILVLTVDPPISQAERDLLATINGISLHTFVALNKSDRLGDEEVTEAVDFTERVCAELIGTAVPVQPCSALRGSADPGFASLTASLQDYLVSHGRRDTDRALAGHLRRVVASMLDDASLRLRTVELAQQGSREAALELRDRLSVISGQRNGVQDRCRGSLERMRRELDARATQNGPELARRCVRELSEDWAPELEGVPTSRLEQAGGALRQRIITTAVEGWRAEVTQQVERELVEVVEQARADVASQLELARQAVQETLDLSLAGDTSAPPLQVDARFHYDYSIPVGWAPPFKGVLTHLRSDASRRQWIRDSMIAGTPALVDRQLGRARADLQQRLQEAGHALSPALDELFSETIDRLLHAVEETAGAGEADDRSRREHLRSRVAALTALMAGTDALAAGVTRGA